MAEFATSVGLFLIQGYLIFNIWNAMGFLPPIATVWHAYGLMVIVRYLLPPRKGSDGKANV